MVKSKMKTKIRNHGSESRDNDICSEHSEMVNAREKKFHIILYTSPESSEDEGIVQKEF